MSERYGSTALLERAPAQVLVPAIGNLTIRLAEFTQPEPLDFPQPDPDPAPEVRFSTGFKKPELEPIPPQRPTPPQPQEPGDTEPGSYRPASIGSTVGYQPQAKEDKTSEDKKTQGGNAGTEANPPPPGTNTESLPTRKPGESGHR